METKYIDFLFLELSQITKATTKKEIDLAESRDSWKAKAELAIKELENIVNADVKTFEGGKEEFYVWARSRANFTLKKIMEGK